MKVNKLFTFGACFGVLGLFVGVLELSSTGFLGVSAFGGGLKR
jgi:hypothetical protein